MANKDHLRILQQGVAVWNRWRNDAPNICPCLDGADLRGIDFGVGDPLSMDHPHAGKFLGNLLRARYYQPSDLGVNFSGAELNNARLGEANLFRANFADAKLCRAKLTGAVLREAKLGGSDLSDATIVEADIRKGQMQGASLQRANLRGANLSGADLSMADLTDANLSQADLRKVTAHNSTFINADLSYTDLTKASVDWSNFGGANLSHSKMVFTSLTDADMAGCRVFGVCVWGVHIGEKNQSNLIITRDDQSTVTVDNLEVAQFIYLLLENPKIREVIDTVTSRVVLILGRFSDERKVILDALRHELRRRGLAPVLFDFDKPASKDKTGTVETLARMARMVIADLTDPSSIPHELATVVPYLRTTPVVPLQLKGTAGYSMFDDLLAYDRWVLPVHHYETKESLIAELAQVLAPAEERLNLLRP